MSKVAPLWRWRLFLIWLSIVGFAGLVGCVAPLLETLGYEYALLISLVTSLGAGHIATCYPGRVQNQLARFPGARFPALVMYSRVLGMGLLLTILPLVLSLLNGLRIPYCNLTQGLAFYLLMPALSVFAATAAGLFAGLLIPGARLASVVWFALFAGSLAWAIYGFYSTPAVYAFGPFFGYFPGVLYDELVAVEARLVTYRISTLLQTLSLVGIAHCLFDPSTLRLRFDRRRMRSARSGATLMFILGAVVMYLAGPALGHRTSRHELEEALGHKVSAGTLDLFFPSVADTELVEALTRDARFSLYKVESFLESQSERRIAVFFFADSAHKASLMGAAGTNVAKPWRSEIYVTLREPPHTVLRHELVHAVSARLGRGPFRVAGALGGLLPNPGLIEGLAVAAQGPRDDLTVHQWTSAMLELGLLPPLEQIFGIGFFGLAAPTAYTAAGSFSAWIRDSFGIDSLRSAYSSNEWESATGKSLEDLEARYREFIGSIRLEQADLAVARYRFDRPSVIHTTCVHEVAKLCGDAWRLSAAGDHDRALALLSEAHERSGRATRTRRNVFYELVDAGRQDRIRTMAADMLADKSIGRVDRAIIKEILADLDMVSGKRNQAAGRFSTLARDAGNEADRRRLQVKAHLAGLTPPAAPRLFDVLAIRPGERAVPAPLASLTIAEAAIAHPNDPVLAYLLARQYFNYRDYESAIARISDAEQLGLARTTTSIWLEARMMRGKALLKLRRYTEAKKVFDELAADETLRLGARAWAGDWRDRCAFEAKTFQ